MWTKLYGEVVAEEKKLYSLYLLLLRLYWGWQLVLIGVGKLMNLDFVASFFARVGIFWPHFFAPVVATFELLGGITMLLGLGVRITMIPIIIILITALGTAHQAASSELFTDPAVLVTQLPVTFLLTALALLVSGAGKYSLDHFIARKLKAHHSK
jgi:putative oxidoreductase